MASTGSSRGGGTRVVLAAIAGLVGLVFLGQGLRLIPGSFMTGQAFWALVGGILVIGAVGYVAWPRLRRR